MTNFEQIVGVATRHSRPSVRCIHAAVATAAASSAPLTATIRIAHFSMGDSLLGQRQNAEAMK
jgi:hypothetical protein